MCALAPTVRGPPASLLEAPPPGLHKMSPITLNVAASSELQNIIREAVLTAMGSQLEKKMSGGKQPSPTRQTSSAAQLPSPEAILGSRRGRVREEELGRWNRATTSTTRKSRSPLRGIAGGKSDGLQGHRNLRTQGHHCGAASGTGRATIEHHRSWQWDEHVSVTKEEHCRSHKHECDCGALDLGP